MKQLVAVVFALCSSYHGQAQSAERVNQESFLHSYQLREVHSSDSLARLTQAIQAIDQLPGDTLSPSYFSRSRYRLLFFHTFGWGQVLAHSLTKFDRTYSSQATGKLVTSSEFIRLFGLQGRDSTALREFPLVIGRDDFYNRRWALISRSARYLVLRYVWSYPNGNVTSGYAEERYYFERVP